MKPLFSVHVKVPATSANLGPGFDVLGVALDLYNDVWLTGWNDSTRPAVSVRNEGAGAGSLPTDKRHLVYRMAKKALDRCGRRVKALELRVGNRIPLARGLGSSSAAIIGGLSAGNAAGGNRLTRNALLQMAVAEEGHPDNVTPALFGGLCASMMRGTDVAFVSWKDAGLFTGLKAVVAVPDYQLSTAKARAVLPKTVSRADAVFNASRVALLLSALKDRRWDLLGEAMDDRLHQPYRKKLVPGWDRVTAAARKGGAYGVALSGAGPTILAIAPAAKAEKIGRAMAEGFFKSRANAAYHVLNFVRKGCIVK